MLKRRCERAERTFCIQRFFLRLFFSFYIWLGRINTFIVHRKSNKTRRNLISVIFSFLVRFNFSSSTRSPRAPFVFVQCEWQLSGNELFKFYVRKYHADRRYRNVILTEFNAAVISVYNANISRWRLNFSIRIIPTVHCSFYFFYFFFSSLYCRSALHRIFEIISRWRKFDAIAFKKLSASHGAAVRCVHSVKPCI